MSIGAGNFPSSMSQQSSGAGLGGGGSGAGTIADRVNTDFPPFSRVFVVCSRGHKEEDIQAAFQQFGQIEDVWMVKDRMTKENKGICYVKYDKASSAALAIENMDGKLVGNEPKPIKVHIHEEIMHVSTVEPVYEGTPEMRISHLIRQMHGPSCIMNCTKLPLKWGHPPLSRTH